MEKIVRIVRITLNKNRGWRGLAELVCENERREDVSKMIFSFSQDMWDDLLRGYIVTQDEDNFMILNFDNTDKLPKPTQQRSVLIKSFNATIMNTWTYPKKLYNFAAPYEHRLLISHFIKNRNNHTTSDWNCIRHKSCTNDIGLCSKQMFYNVNIK